MLCWSTLIMTRFPFSNAVTFENTIPLWSPIITGKRTQRNNRSYTSHLQHMTSSLPKKWNELVSSCHNLPVGLWQQEAHTWSSFLTFLHWDTIFSYYWGRWGEPEDIVFIYFFIDKRQKEKEKKQKRGLKCSTSHRALSLQWPLVGGEIDPENKGSFPLPVYLHTALYCQFELSEH